ncbi:MAG: hypothetical protein K8R60_20350 [Burkholderiales bacterium]|nr:hypothetical protein [Burkholderiales bacterium]
MASRSRGLLLAALPALALAQPAPVDIDFGPGAEDRAPPVADAARRAGTVGLRARSIRVEGRWAEGVDLGLATCDVVTPENIAAAMETLAAAITRSPAATATLVRSAEAELLYVAVDFDQSPGSGGECGEAARTVGIVFRPYHLRVSLARIGNNVLPVPRSALATVYDKVPAPLRALNPQFGFGYDKAFGTVFSLSLDTDLLALAAPAGPRRNPLDAHLQRVQSAREGFHRTEGDLAWRVRQGGPVLKELRLQVAGSEGREPLAAGERSYRSGELGLGLRLAPAAGLRVALDGAWRESRDDTTAAPVPAVRSETRRLASRVLVDALQPPGEGFLRGALWHEAADADGGGRFNRLAAQVGYARELAFGAGPTWGLELMGGAGRVSAGAPAVERFLGGNTPGQFLYDGADAPTLLQAPRGPLLRSAGLQQAGLAGQRGGTRYWQLNAQLAVPVPAWSRPLIPDEPTGLEDAQGRPVGLKTLLRRQVDVSGPSMLAATLSAQGVPADEAQRQAEAALAEVKPAVHFLVDRASLFAVRPLLLVDAAGLSDGADSARWLAVGAGIGVTVVTARFEAGVMRTVSGPAIAGGRSAAFLRVVFQNLF